MLYLYVANVLAQLNMNLGEVLEAWDRDRFEVYETLKYIIEDILGTEVYGVELYSSYLGDKVFVAEFTVSTDVGMLSAYLIDSDDPHRALEDYAKAQAEGRVHYNDENY